MHATAVTASRSIPAADGQLSVYTMASCYSCCAQSLPGPIVPFVLVLTYAFFCLALASVNFTASDEMLNIGLSQSVALSGNDVRMAARVVGSV